MVHGSGRHFPGRRSALPANPLRPDRKTADRTGKAGNIGQKLYNHG
jgi:hypothetical protein